MSSLGKVPTFFLAHSFSIFTPSSFCDREEKSSNTVRPIQKLGCCRAVSHSPLLKGSRLVDGGSKKKSIFLIPILKGLLLWAKCPWWSGMLPSRRAVVTTVIELKAWQTTAWSCVHFGRSWYWAMAQIRDFFFMSRRARELKQLAFYSWFVQLHHSKARVFALW